MNIRAYLRVSTKDQSLARQRDVIDRFCSSINLRPVSYYSETICGAKRDRPELHRLIDDSHEGDILVAESVDRVSRMSYSSWLTLKEKLAQKKIRMVFVDLPITHQAIHSVLSGQDPIEDRMVSIVNDIMVELMAAFAQKNYLLMKLRQQQGIERAKALGIYQVKAKQMAERRIAIERLLLDGAYTWREISKLTGGTQVTINEIKRRLVREGRIEKRSRAEQYKLRREQRKAREEADFERNHIEILRDQCAKYGLKILETKEASPVGLADPV